MKRIAVINMSKVRKMMLEASLITKVGIYLSFFTLGLFLALGTGSVVQSKIATTPLDSMKGLAASVSNEFFLDMLGLEVPHLNQEDQYTFSPRHVMGFAFRFITNINPVDPKSFLSQELPGLGGDQSIVLHQGQAADNSPPVDLMPSSDVVQGEPDSSAQPVPTLEPTPAPTPEPAANQEPPKITRNVAFVYQTHSNESYLPELKGIDNPDKAYDSKINVTLVGKKLAEQLEKNGVGSIHSETIYPNVVKGFKYPFSYKYSLKTLEEAATAHPDLTYYFDIHRDSQPRNKTTVTIDGKDYAQVYFIIGGKNPKWKANEQFASQIHQALDKKYPGISKGIHAKTETNSNGIYNQNFSPNSILIEIGGPYNTLEESYRTASYLSEAISQVILNAEKVSGGS
ncbi:stage II sporulation protein P [Paenibacillus larvae]